MSERDYRRVLRSIEDDPRVPWDFWGWPVWAFTPEEVRDIPRLSRNASREEKRARRKMVDTLCRYRLRPTQYFDDGRIQFECPVHAGYIKVMNEFDDPEITQKYKDMPTRRSAIEAFLPDGVTDCCRQQTSVFHPDDIPLWQEFFPFTTVWTVAMNRRLIAETANSQNKGQNTNLETGYFNVFTITKVNILLTWAIMGHNIRIILKEEEIEELQRLREEWARLKSRGHHKKKVRRSTLADFVTAHVQGPAARGPPGP